MKKDKGGMKSPKMPSEHTERREGQLNKPCGRKYAPNDSMGNPESLDKTKKELCATVQEFKSVLEETLAAMEKEELEGDCHE